MVHPHPIGVVLLRDPEQGRRKKDWDES